MNWGVYDKKVFGLLSLIFKTMRILSKHPIPIVLHPTQNFLTPMDPT